MRETAEQYYRGIHCFQVFQIWRVIRAKRLVNACQCLEMEKKCLFEARGDSVCSKTCPGFTKLLGC